MNNMMKMAKRVLALALVLTLMLGSVGGYAPGWFRALATEAAEGGEATMPPTPDNPALEPPEAPTAPEAPAVDAAPEVPAAQETASGADAPAETGDAVAADTPVETETAAETDTPVEAETAVDTDVPVETETAADTDTPVEEETDAEKDTPVETETAAETNVPVEAGETAAVEEPAATGDGETAAPEEQPTEPGEETTEPGEEATEPEEEAAIIEEGITETEEEPTESEEETAGTEEEAAEPEEETTEPEEEAAEPEEEAAIIEEGITETEEEPTEPEEETPATEEETTEPEENTAEPEAAPAEAEGLLGVQMNAAQNEVALARDAASGTVQVEQQQTAPIPAANAGDSGTDKKEGISVLQQRIDKVLSANGRLTGTVRIILERNTIFEGNSSGENKGKIVIDAGARDIGDDFAVELITEDAGETGTEGEGFTTINADLIIRGVKVVMKSIMMAAGKSITVRAEDAEQNKDKGGHLVFNGTANAPNELIVNVNKNSSAEIYAVDNDDVITATTAASAKSLYINAGDGLNRINVNAGGGRVEIVTGSGNDTVDVNISGANKGVYVDTGSSTDYVTIVDAAQASTTQIPELDADGKPKVDKEGNPVYKKSGTYEINTGDGDDQITVDLRAGAGSMTVNTGTGGAVIDVLKGDYRSIENLDYKFNPNSTEQIKPAQSNTKITFVNEDASAVDRYTVDVNAGLAVDELHFGKGAASVYLKGKLNYRLPEGVTNPIGYIGGTPAQGFQMHVASSQDDKETAQDQDLTLKITYADPGKVNFTDALKNKKRVEVYTTGTGIFNVTANDDFTDYVIKTPVSRDIERIVVSGSTKPLMLSNLVFDADELGDDAPYIPGVTGENGSLANLNVLIKAPTIDIIRTIRAQNVRAESALGSLSLGGAFENYHNGQSLGDIAADMISVADAAEINVRSSIETAHDIALVARVKHFGSLFTLLPAALDLVNVKLARAVVNINAGADLSARGNVTAQAKIDTTIGYYVDVDGETHQVKQKQVGGPIGIDVVVNNASVNVAHGANIEADNDIILAASSDVRAYNYANYGGFFSPVALSVTAITNTVNVQVNGTLNAGRKVKLDASGSVEDETRSTYQSGVNVVGGGAVGGFVAVNVVDQAVHSVIGEHAHVTAGGDVAVYSSNVANVQTIATAGGDKMAQQSSPTVVSAIGLFKALSGILFDKFKGTFVDREAEKFVKTVTKLSASDYSIRVVEPSDDNEQGGSTTVKTKVGDKLDKAGNVATYGIIEPKANDGYKVQTVMIRYLGYDKTTGAANDHYTYEEVVKNQYGQYLFLLENADVEVMVTYAKEGAAGGNAVAADGQQQVDVNADDLEDSFELPDLFEDAAEGIAGNADDADDVAVEDGAQAEDGHAAHDLVFDSEYIKDGSIVTWKTGEDGKSLKSVRGGQKIRLIPNANKSAEDGSAVTELKSLSVVYTHTVDGNEVVETIKIEADSQGRYIFTVPDDIPADVKLYVHAEFGAIEDNSARQPAHKQLTGSLAVGVTLNKGGSRIASGSVVTAGGDVDMFGYTRTYTNTQADGTAITPKDAAQVAKEQSKPQTVQKVTYSVQGANVSMKVNGTLPGTITRDVDPAHAASVATPKLTFKLDDAYKSQVEKVSVVISYYTKINPSLSAGKRVSETVELDKTSDGVYTFDLNTTKYAEVDGSTLEITFMFKDADGNLVAIEGDAKAASKFVVPNAIRTSVNQLKEAGQSTNKVLGKLDFHDVRYADDDTAKAKPLYYFTITPEAGYKCDPAAGGSNATATTVKSNKSVLYASWIGADGSPQKGTLTHDDTCAVNEWYFKSVDGNNAVPAGALITITAVFSEDARKIVTNDNGMTIEGSDKLKGSAKLSKEAAKEGDKVTVKLTGNDGYMPAGMTAYVTSTANPSQYRELAVTLNDKGEYEFTVPHFKDDTEKLYISPRFAAKTIEMKSAGTEIMTSESDRKAAKGQTVTIQLTDDDIKAGKKLDPTNTTVTYQGRKLAVDSKGRFTIPTGDEYTATELTINAALVDKAIEMKEFVSGEDKIAPVSKLVDPGETVTLKVEAREGYRAKAGTVKATITIQTASGTSTRQVFASWKEKDTYTLKLPTVGDGETITNIQLAAEFEPGSDGVALSMGVGVAVGVTLAENILEIQGGSDVPVLDENGDPVKENGKVKTRHIDPAQVTDNGLSMVAVSVGSKAITEAKAGYNEGDTGVAGAIAVQVAKTTTDVAVRKDAQIKHDGLIFMMAKAKQDFKVTGDASGKKDGNEAEGTGVGAGIAFAIDGLTTRGVIEDGVVFKEGSKASGITINVGHKEKDQVTAKAGAAGGSAWVPVAAVDVFNSEVLAEMGSLKDKNGRDLNQLDVSGKVKIKASGESAKAQYNHEVTADASARGGKTAMGGAFIVTWLKNDVQALLNQSLNATKDISISAIAGDALKAVAKAAASGGDAGGEDEKGDGSADKQANSILKGAGGVAGRFGGLDGAAIKNGANDRQKAETAEQTVTGAGAFVLNVMKNASRAEIKDGVNITTQGALTVSSTNRTDATVKADASATKSDVGVGIGVAINIVTMDNIARIGNGSVSADSLAVTAEIAKAPTKVRTVTVAEDETRFSNAFTEQIKEALRDMVGPEVAKKVGWLIDIDSEGIGKFCQTLIDDLNLGTLFDLMNNAPGDAFENFGKAIWERLKDFPKVLIQPLLEAYQEVYHSGEYLIAEDGLKQILDTVWAELSVQLPGEVVSTVKDKLINEGMSKIGGSIIDMVTAKITGKGDDGEKIKETLKDVLIDSLKGLMDKMIDNTVRAVGAQLPLLNPSNITLVQELKKKSWADLKASVIPYITTTFRTTVWDYAPVVEKIQADGFVGAIQKELRKALKESSVAMTNEAIDKLLGVMNVKFEREAIEDRHIVTTQAIAGSGAKKKSGAGSLAIAVANLNTLAEIAGGSGSVTVTGDMTVNAEEVRRVRTHSTAAVDERGEADNNDGAGDSDNANTGGGDAATTTATDPDGNVTVTTGVGGSVLSFGGMNDDESIEIEAQDGYCLEKGKLVRTYCKADGTEVVDKLDFESAKGDDGAISYWFDPMDGVDTTGMTDEEIESLKINIDVEFTELLKEIPKPTLRYETQGKEYPADKQITVSVEGRENDESGKAWGKVNDLGEITIPVEPGLKVSGIVVTGMDGISFITYGVGEDDDEIVQASANDSEEVYVFKVPAQGVKSILVTFVEDNDAEHVEQQRQAQKDRAGRTVGVGAAFTLTYGKSSVKAAIGDDEQGTSRNVTAGTLSVTASSEHEEENYATAGADPFEGTSDDIKDFALDAAVSVNILDNDVRAAIAKGGQVTTTAKPDASDDAVAPAKAEDEEEEEEEDLPEEIDVTKGALIVSATEVGASETKASAFAAGSTTAVGASVAVNVSLSDITAEMNAAAKVSGKAVVRTHTLSRDDTWSFASAMGADIQRSLNKFSDGASTVAEKANDVTTGKIFDEKKETKGNKTNSKINDRLNDKRVIKDDGQKARGDLNVSANVMRSQNVQVDNGEDAGEGANAAKDFVNVEGGQGVDGFQNPNKKSSLRVAAALGVTVALHSATTSVNQAINAAREILVSATNAGNFNTRSTGAAMSLAKEKGKSIAAAVGISVNRNQAHATVNGNLAAADGDVTVSADLKQNLTDTYRGRLAVQSIAGAVSGKGSDTSVAGALSLLFSYGETDAIVDGDLKGNAVSVTANDKSKLAVRAGGINVSKGANVGAGVSVATIWSANTVKAEVKDGATIDADSFTLKAVKAPVTWDDYRFPLSLQDLISDSSDLDDGERENVYPGLIDVHKKPGEKSYTVSINMDTYALMKLADMLNFLSSKNYYTEAIAGSLVTGQADSTKPNKLNAAGSISIVRALNSVEAVLGNNVTINKGGNRAKGDVTILAQDDTTVRMIGGAVAAGSAKNSAGITLTFLYDKDEAKAVVGDNLNIKAGSVSHRAVASTNVESYNAAASVSSASQADKSIGGGLDVVLLNTIANAKIGDSATVDAGGKLDIAADSNLNLMLISVSASVAKAATAAGGTIAVLVNDAEAKASVGKNHSLSADGDVTVAGRAVDKLLSVIASASAAVTSKSAAAGSLNVLVDNAKGKAFLDEGGAGKGIASRKGSVSLLGETETRVANVTVAVAGGKDKATGLSANINVLHRDSGVEAKGGAGYVIDAAKDVLISSHGMDVSRVVSMAVAAASSGNGISGNLPVLVSRNKVKTTLGSVTVKAGGEAAFASRLDDVTKAIAGSLGLSWSSNAAAATAMFVNKENEVTTDMGASSVTAAGSSGALSRKLPGGEAFTGIYVGAKVVDDILAVAAGIAAAGNKGLTGNLLWSSNKNVVKADASQASLSALAKNASGKAVGGGSVTVNAANDSKQIIFAGGLNAAKSVAAGASIAVLTAAKEVTAKAHNAKAWQDVNVAASNTDNVFEMALSAGGSGKAAVEIGIAYQSLKSRVNAVVASEIEANRGSFNLKSVNDVNLDNTAVALAGAGKAAVTPVFAVSVFTGESNAILGGGTVKAAKGVNVSATANKDMGQYTVGAAASGQAAVSGAVSVASLKDTTNALVSNGTVINADTLDVTAQSDLTQVGASAAVAASAKGAVAVNGMLTIAKGNALAEMDGAATLSGKANVKAASERNIVDVAATVAIGGQVGVGVTVMGLVAGDRMDQDAADMLTYGNSSTKNGSKTFDSTAIIDKMHELGIKDTSDLEEKKDKDGNVTQTSLADDLTGNGHSNGNTSVGTNGKFDATSGFVEGDTFDGAPDSNDDKQDMTETEDIKKARAAAGNTAYTSDPQDSVVARIGKNGNVTARGVDVYAEQDTKADVVGATVSGGSMAGVGVSVAIAMLRSNVFATSLGTVDAKEGSVNVTAVSKSGGVMPDGDEQARTAAISKDLGESEDDELKESLTTLKDMLSKRSIRVVGVAAGIGSAGVGAAGSVVRTDNITRATLGGTVKNAGALNVDAASDYGNVSALTLAVGGGAEAGLSAAFAMAMTNGTVESKIDRSANITGANTKIAVTSESVVKANALAVTAAAGGVVGGAAGVAIAANSLTQNTLVERGAKIDMTGENATLKVKGTSSTKADTFLLGVSIGSGAAGFGEAASIVSPTLNTGIGTTGSGTVSLGKLASVDVLNDVTSSATANVLSVSAGGVALQGNVLLVFNDTDATAKVANASGTLGSMKINGELGATGRSRLAAAAVGGSAGGVSVSYVDVDSKNNAILDTDNFTATVLGDLTVSTGEDDTRKTSADAASVAAGIAATVSVSLNAAVARNRAVNSATITGKRGLTAANVNLKANANGDADARFYGLSVGTGSVAGSVDVALNETTAKAIMKLDGALNANLNAASDVDGATTAKMYTGSGAIYGAKVNVAVAYGKTNSIVDVDIAKAPTKKVDIAAHSTGKDDVTTTIDNQSFEVFSAAAMVGTAYSKDNFSARVKLRGGDYDLGKVDVKTDYDTNAEAVVTPSAAGVDVSFAKLAVNYAGANSTATAGSELELADGANLKVDGDIAVKTVGKAETNAQVVSAKYVTTNVIGVGVSISDSEMNGRQAATLRMNGGSIEKASDLRVQSLTDKALATAAVGTSGVGEDEADTATVSLVNVNVNSATARENLASTAAILGSGRDANTIAADSLTLMADTGMTSVKDEKGIITDKPVVTTARSKSATATEIGIVSGGGLLSDATSTDSFNVVLSGVAADIAGEANLTSSTHTEAFAEGSNPGNWTLLQVAVTEMEAKVGEEGDRQTSKVIVGDETTLTTGGALKIAASNNGNAHTDLSQASANSIVGVKVSKLPTDSWYDTGVSIGSNAVLTSEADASITSDSSAKAKSIVESDGVGLVVDVSVMKGKNVLHDENNLDIGDGTEITTGDDLTLSSTSSAQLTAKTVVSGGGALAGEYGTAENTVTRANRVTIADNAKLTSEDGALSITAASGEADDIQTNVKVTAGGLFLLGNATAETSLTANSEILVGQNVELNAREDMDLLARSTSRTAKGGVGLNTEAKVDAKGAGLNPDSDATITLNMNTYIDINRDSDGSRDTTQLISNNGDINMHVDNAGLNVHAYAKAEGKAAAGWSNADAVVEANLGNTIWVDSANLYPRRTVTLLASSGGRDGDKPSFDIEATAEMYAAGAAYPHAELKGLPFNQVRTNNARKVARRGKFVHEAINPRNDVKRNIVAKCSDTTTAWVLVRDSKNEFINWEGAKYRCDFCTKDQGERSDAAASVRDKTGLGIQPPHAASFAKALSPLVDIQRMLEELGISKARYGEEDYAAASAIFVLDYPVMLQKDVTLSGDQLNRYRLWTNVATQLDVHLLPNATRLYGRHRNGKLMLQYVAEVIRGDVRGDGETHEIDIITALTDYAASHPVIPIGSTGSLDFSTGALMLPARADFELYLHEVSGQWLIDKLGEGFIRMLTGDQDEINEAVLNGRELPDGQIVESLIDGGDRDGWKLYWLGDTPKTATDPDQVLVGLLVNPDTDEVDAFRTSVNMLNNGEDPVDVSLYLYRDSKADRMEIEKYNAMFFDTPEGEKSLVKVVTDVLMERELEMPKSLNIVLRAWEIEGTDFPVYSLTDHFFALCDGTDGGVSMFDGFYTNTFDGDTFDSDYIHIEGIVDGDLNVTVKQGQNIWPEWTDEDAASDIAGNDYARVDGVWGPETEAPQADELPEESAKA